jgi:hypothetical protein
LGPEDDFTQKISPEYLIKLGLTFVDKTRAPDAETSQRRHLPEVISKRGLEYVHETQLF